VIILCDVFYSQIDVIKIYFYLKEQRSQYDEQYSTYISTVPAIKANDDGRLKYYFENSSMT